jgi:hypothetical protein
MNNVFRNVTYSALDPSVQLTTSPSLLMCQFSVKFRVQFSRFSSFFFGIRPNMGPTHPPIQWVLRALSPKVKRPESEADHSPPSSADVKECVDLCLHPPTRLHGTVLSYSTGITLSLRFLALDYRPANHCDIGSFSGHHGTTQKNTDKYQLPG